MIRTFRPRLCLFPILHNSSYCLNTYQSIDVRATVSGDALTTISMYGTASREFGILTMRRSLADATDFRALLEKGMT